MKRLMVGGALVFSLAGPQAAWALPAGPAGFCTVYPDSPLCSAGTPACTLCHKGAPPTRNVFGKLIEAQLLPGASRPLSKTDFLMGLDTALKAIEAEDADMDGHSNIDEILAGTLPANSMSLPRTGSCEDGGVNDSYKVCKYDEKYTYKKIYLDFCGKSPTWDELTAFEASQDKKKALHDALSQCLDSEFWIGKDGQVWQLAHRKIKPIQAIKSGPGAGPVPLGDYDHDYSIFVYTQIDDHDAREVMTADYFVERSDSPTSYAKVMDIGSGQASERVVTERRAGLLTTRWNLILNVMFTALPRTAAAQAYRSFLGKDIAKLEGLAPIEGEPVDYDEKGVEAPACKVCHSTLDPASYAFRNYQGLTGRNGTYDPTRIEDDFRHEGQNIVDMPEVGYVLGQRVENLTEWAQVASSSDEFAAATVMDYWHLLMGAAPEANQQEAYKTLWQDLKGKNNYSVERMLHDLIDTEAYGVP